MRKRFVLFVVPFLLLVPLFVPVPAMAGSFGLQSLEVSATEAPSAGQEPGALGPADAQAGSHPYALTTSFTLNESEEYEPERFRLNGGALKDVRLELPPGFVGNPNATPKCPYHVFIANVLGHECPNDTVVGLAVTEFAARLGYINKQGKRVNQILYKTNPVYNIETPGGVAAEFGYLADRVAPILLNASVRTGGDYGITVNVHDVTEGVIVSGSKVTIWGVPADPSHDLIRGECLGEAQSSREGVEESGKPYNDEQSMRKEEEERGVEHPVAPVSCPANVPSQPLLTNPTSCGEPRTAVFSADSWKEPGDFVSNAVALPELTGCEKLDFSPTLTVTPDGTAGSTPTGLNVDVHVSQESTSNPLGLGEADVKDTTVTLPAGVQISPSAADGLQACPQLHGKEAVKEEREHKREEVGIDLESDAPANCPDASKIATVKIKTPLLEGELEGAVYLASPQNFAGLPENPFGSLIAMYLVAEEPATGVLVKLAGKVSLSETGQITTTFENTPQLPFSDLKLEFYGTARAPLATPGTCGTYTTASMFAPWSGEAPQSPSASFEITSGPNGSACADPLPFSPSLQSGSPNINAGAFSNLTTTLSREDGQQNIQQVTLHYPPGLSGILTGVKLCGEAEANTGTCGLESEIGETIVSVGLGNDPFSVTGGKVYLTGPYEGAPFGLSIVNPAKAGPFDLQEGHPVVVRAKIEVDPHTAALTVTTNTAAQGYAIPTIIEGIPLQIKHVNVNITRPGFTFNPTNCNKTEITGSVGSDQGAVSPVAVPFQVTNCQALKFEPKFSVSTSAKTSKALGASLTATVSEPPGSLGTQANITKVKVELPKALPSRLTTLQKACTQARFQANPAGCPPESVIGSAIVHTPLVPVPLEGPVYFVSNGGEAFPNLIMVLQGYGVKIDLVGDTLISKSGITSTTFKTVPDQPFSSFQITLPEKPYSALAANGNLCAPTRTVTVKKKVSTKAKGHKRTTTREVKETLGEPLLMPNEFVAQNGAVIHQTTTISVTGCVKAKKASTKKKHKKKKKQ